MRKYGESKTTRVMMVTVLHVTSGLGLRKFQADGFLLTRVYILKGGQLYCMLHCVRRFDSPDLRAEEETMQRRDTDLFCRLAYITADIPQQCGFPVYKSCSHLLHGMKYIH